MRRSLLGLGLFAGALLVAACSIAGDDAASQEAAHTEGDPTYAQNEWLWANETFDEFKTSATANAWTGEVPEYLPLDHPMTQRLQFWMDRLDEALRAAYPEKLAGVPHPQAVVQKSAVVNAWVSCIPVEWNVPVKLAANALVAADSGAADAGDPDASAPIAPAPNEDIFLYNGQVFAGGYVPIARPHDEAKLAEFAKFVNDGYSKCRAEVKDGAIELGEGCIKGDPAMATTASKLSFCATGKYITFTTSYILESLEEDRLIATMAHEMGHFYRSHVNMPSDVVNYFYALEETHAHKPAPDPRTVEQTAQVRAKLRGEIPFTDWNAENALMKDRRLGFYTTEQEADEIGLELMAKVGVPPSMSITDMLAFLKLYPEDQAGGMSYAECSTLRESGFRDENGKLVSPPVGDPSNVHHNSCFRVFNMQREIAAHKYALGARPTPPGEAWSTIVTRFGVEVSSAPDAGAPTSDAGAPIADAGTD